MPPSQTGEMNPAEFSNIATLEQKLWWFRGQRKILYSLLDPIVKSKAIGTVMEAGCGTGYMSGELAERYGWSMFPVDIAWEGLSYGRKLGVKRLCQGDISAIPYADQSFDALVSFDVIVHFPLGAEQRPLAEFARVVKPGGLLVLRVPAYDLLRSRHSVFAHERQRFTKGRLLRQVKEAGFRVQRCSYANSFLLPVAFTKFRIWEPLTRQEPRSGVAPVAPWLDHLLHAPLSVEAKMIGAGLDLPAGQSILLVAERES
jgi:SAM-dependent methyltransferase